MADNPLYRDGRDDTRVNIHQAHEVRYWTEKWAITEATLRNAVSAAGVLVKDVEAWLRRNRYIQ